MDKYIRILSPNEIHTKNTAANWLSMYTTAFFSVYCKTIKEHFYNLYTNHCRRPGPEGFPGEKGEKGNGGAIGLPGPIGPRGIKLYNI